MSLSKQTLAEPLQSPGPAWGIGDTAKTEAADSALIRPAKGTDNKERGRSLLHVVPESDELLRTAALCQDELLRTAALCQDTSSRSGGGERGEEAVRKGSEQ